MILNRRNLPLNALRAFEATGRHCHMRAAAEELGVTHGAISRHIRHLEELFGVELFERLHNRLTLTSAGSRLLVAVREGLDSITQGVLYIDPSHMAGPLQIASTPSIVTNWLLKIIIDFHERYPETEIRLQRIEPTQRDLSPEFDVAVCYGHPGVSRYVVDELFHEEFFPVASPLLFETGKIARKPAQFVRYTLLHDHLQNWPTWFRSTNGRTAIGSKNLYLHDAFQAINAARRGIGIALADKMEVFEDLRSGSLIRLSENTISASAAVFLVHHTEDVASMRARVFSEWVTSAVTAIRTT